MSEAEGSRPFGRRRSRQRVGMPQKIPAAPAPPGLPPPPFFSPARPSASHATPVRHRLLSLLLPQRRLLSLLPQRRLPMANDGEKGGREGLPCSPDAPPGLPCSPDAPPSLPCSPDAPSGLPCSPLLPGSGSPTSPRALSRPDPARILCSRRRPSCPKVSPARIRRTGPPLLRLSPGSGSPTPHGRRQGDDDSKAGRRLDTPDRLTA